MNRKPPSLESLIAKTRGGRPLAFVLAGHNGSGKSTLWYTRLADALRIPLVNADRMILSILPEPDGATRRMPTWAQALRDNDVRWQSVAQRGVREFKRLAMDDQIPFAFETVFSHWVRQPDGSHASKAEDILQLQAAGYYVVLIFVGLASVDYSILRVQARKQQGGHDVPLAKLQARFSRTQAAVGHASRVADMTWMFDNSRGVDAAFTLARVQMRSRVLYDARDLRYAVDAALREVCSPWLDRVSGPFRPLGTSAAK